MAALFAEINEYTAMGACLSIAMGAILFGILYHFITRRAKCCVETEAVIDDIVVTKRGRGTFYIPVYRWYYDGKEYQKNGTGIAFNIYATMTTVTLRIDPEQPDDFFDIMTWKKNMMWAIPVTVFLLVAGLTAI